MIRTFRHKEVDRVMMLDSAWKKRGRYVFASDHSIPNNVSLDTMRQISDLALKLGKH